MPGANLELSLVELGPSIICQRGGVGLSGFTLKIGRVYNTPRHKYDTKRQRNIVYKFFFSICAEEAKTSLLHVTRRNNINMKCPNYNLRVIRLGR